MAAHGSDAKVTEARIVDSHASAVVLHKEDLECNTAKLYAAEVAKRLAPHGLQMIGAYGYSMEYAPLIEYCNGPGA